MRTISPARQDRFALLLLTVGVPLFFPGILLGLVPGPFAAGYSDSFNFFEPYALAFINAVKAGHSPFWSNLSSFGAPSLLTLGTGALHPFHLLHFLLPDWLAFAAGWWLRLALFGAYAYAYLRLCAVRPWIALPFALGLCYGSFFLNYSLEIIGYVVCFFPMALFHAHRICNEPRPLNLLLLTIAVIGMILGGFPSVILYLLLALAAYILAMSKGPRQIAYAYAAVFLGCCFTLPALLETIHFYPSTGYDPEQRHQLFFYKPPTATTLGLFIPSTFGDIFDYAKAGMRDFYGSQLGAGILAAATLIVLTGHRLWQRSRIDRRSLFWVITFGVCLAIYLDLFHIKSALHYIPIINEHPLTRLQTLIAMAAAFGAAMLLERAARGWRDGGPSRQTTWALAAVTAAAYACAYLLYSNKASTSHLVVFLTITMVAVAAMEAAARGKRGAPTVFILSNVAASLLTSLSYVHYFSPTQYYPGNENIRHIQEALLPGGRVLDIQDVLFRQTAAAYNVPSITNHWFSPAPLREWVASLSGGDQTRGLTIDSVRALKHASVWEALRKMHVQFVIAPNAQLRGGDTGNNTAAEFRRIGPVTDEFSLVEVLYDHHPLSKTAGLHGEGYTGFIEQPGRVTLTANKPDFTIPIRYDDGWSVAAGAASLFKSPTGLIEITGAAPSQSYTLAFYPRYLDVRLFIVSAMLLVLLLIIAARRPPSSHQGRTTE